MPTYTIEVRVKVWGESPREAYEDVKLALRNSKRQEIVYIDMETVATEADDDTEALKEAIASAARPHPRGFEEA